MEREKAAEGAVNRPEGVRVFAFGGLSREQIKARFQAMANEQTKPWWRVTNLSGEDGPAEVEIYDEIGWLGQTAADFLLQLKQITAKEITLRVNSPGGEIFDGIAIYNALRSHPARVTTYVDSLAASIASVIALAGDDVVMQPFSQMMIHDGQGFCMGDAADMRNMADLLDRQSDNIAAIYAEKAGGRTDRWRAKMREENWYTAEETVNLKLADRVNKPKRQGPVEPEANTRLVLTNEVGAEAGFTVFFYAGRDPLLNTAVEPEAKKAPPFKKGDEDDDEEMDDKAAAEDGMAECPECGERMDETELSKHRRDEHDVVETEDETSVELTNEADAEVGDAAVSDEDSPEDPVEGGAGEEDEEPDEEEQVEEEPSGFSVEVPPRNAWDDVVAHLLQPQLTWDQQVAHLLTNNAERSARRHRTL